MDNIKNILFDLDGTIINPKEGILNSIKYSLNHLKLSIPSDKELEKFIGPPLIDSYSKNFNLSPEQATKAVNLYRDFYADKGVHQSVLYNNIEEILNYLSNKNYRLFVATSKPTVFAKAIITHYNLNSLFIDVVGANLDNTRKDKTDIIDFTLKSHNLKSNESVMIGDTIYDIIGAKNNNLISIGVTYGFGSRLELERERANYIINDIQELANYF
jgi:phosphoglycolate phosphatase